MSEKLPELIWALNKPYSNDQIYILHPQVVPIAHPQLKTDEYIPYILKSKFDLLEAELKECKEGFTKQIDEFYELRKVTIDTINQRNELLLESERLKAELEKVKGENEWISVEDRLPEPAEFCLVSDKQGVNKWPHHYMPEIKTWFDFEDGQENDSITHWKPLPQPPTK